MSGKQSETTVLRVETKSKQMERNLVNSLSSNTY